MHIQMEEGVYLIVSDIEALENFHNCYISDLPTYHPLLHSFAILLSNLIWFISSTYMCGLMDL